MTYTDAHVTLPAGCWWHWRLPPAPSLAAASAVAAPRVRWLVAAVLPAIALFLGTGAVGAYVESFIVKPNELVREQPFITHNIEMTRQAYGLDAIAQRAFPAEPSASSRGRSGEQPGDAPEHPAVGLARAAGHAAPDPGDPHLLRLPRHRHRPLRHRRHDAAGDARGP